MDKLKFINEQMDILAVPYMFGEWEWSSEENQSYPYSVGEITETEPMTEDGAEESTFLLSLFHRGQTAIDEIEGIKAKIKKHFPAVYGLREQTENGTIAVFYGGAFYVPTNEADLKRMQINLIIKEWKGDI